MVARFLEDAGATIGKQERSRLGRGSERSLPHLLVIGEMPGNDIWGSSSWAEMGSTSFSLPASWPEAGTVWAPDEGLLREGMASQPEEASLQPTFPQPPESSIIPQNSLPQVPATPSSSCPRLPETTFLGSRNQ